MKNKKSNQNLWLGREFEESEGPISELRLKIPTFTRSPFRIGAGVNEYRDLIAREPWARLVSGMKLIPRIASVYLLLRFQATINLFNTTRFLTAC